MLGQGRCIQTARTAPDRYRHFVLWACRHVVSFDSQCEGNRAWFIYQLIDCYENKTPFPESAIKSFESSGSDGGWKILYLAELLYQFSCGGEQAAAQALWRKYEKLYTCLLKKRRPKGTFPERDAFEMFCQILAVNTITFLKIAEDVGRLYQEKPFYDGFDFDWLYESKGKEYLSALAVRAEKSNAIAGYLRVSHE